jgi:hypothetical protein
MHKRHQNAACTSPLHTTNLSKEHNRLQPNRQGFPTSASPRSRRGIARRPGGRKHFFSARQATSPAVATAHPIDKAPACARRYGRHPRETFDSKPAAPA